MQILVRICIFMGKDSSTFTHSWESLQAKKCEEL